MHVRKRKRSLFPAIHQSNKSSLHLDVTEAPRSETESPFLYCSNILSCGYKAGKWISSWIQWGTASEGSPALWWWSWKLHHSPVWPISPDNSLWGTYRRMGQDPKKRACLGRYSIITSIIFCMVQVSLALQETPVTISRWNSQISSFHVSPRFPWVREGSSWMERAPSSPQVLSWTSSVHPQDSVNMPWRKPCLWQVSNNVLMIRLLLHTLPS